MDEDKKDEYIEYILTESASKNLMVKNLMVLGIPLIIIIGVIILVSEISLTKKLNGTFYYTFNENFVYEIYAQPYHLTDIILEDGEIVMGNPLLSEDDSVWELTANVAKNPVTGESIQHLFIKPAYSGLDSSFIVITDRRVYHLRIKSYKDIHMTMVKFTYPQIKNK